MPTPDEMKRKPANSRDNGSLEDIGVLEADRNAPPPRIVRKGATFESFKHRDFSWFWAGSLVSNTGTWMQTTVLAMVVWALRGRELDLGIVNFVSGIPVLFLALPAGLLADRVNKRMLLIWSQALMGVLAAALWWLYHIGRLTPEHSLEALLWISGIGLLGGVLSAIAFPTWLAFLPDLVPRPNLMNAIALNSAQFQASRLLGPLAASVFILVGFARGDIFLVNAASYLFVIASLIAIRPHHSHEGTTRPHEEGGVWRTLMAGVDYARENKVVGTLVISTALMTVLAMPYMTLLPSIAEKSLGGGDAEYLWLMAANGFGAIFGSLAVAGLPPETDRERVIPAAIAAMSLLLIAFAASRSFALSVVLSVLVGAAFLTINSLTNTSIQAMVPSRLRGRVMALFVMSFIGIMPISAGLFGPLGEWIGPGNAVAAGAVVLMGWGLYLAASKKLRPE